MTASSFTKTDTLKAKAIAVILMLFHHLFRKDTLINAYDLNPPALMSIETLNRLATAARVCVWIFVFLSAYGISLKLMKNRKGESTARILYKQWWSLMKPYWFIYIVLFLISFTFPESAYAFHEGNWAHIFTDFLGFSEFFGTGLWTGSWWYMCFSQVLLISLPFLVLLVDKMSVFSIPVTYLILLLVGPGIKSTNGGYYSNYLYAALLAILFVKYDLFDRFRKRPQGLRKVLEAVVLLLAFWLLAEWKVPISKTEYSGISTLLSAFSVAALCLFVQKYATCSWLEKSLAFIGKHSGNIYLVHVALYKHLPEVIFCTKSVLGSLVILLVVSLLVSIALEGLKKLLRYDKLMSFLSCKILSWATPASVKTV